MVILPTIDQPEQAGLIGAAWFDQKLRALLVSRLKALDFVGPDRTLMTALEAVGDEKFSYLVAEQKLNDPARKRLVQIQAVIAGKPGLEEYTGWLRVVEKASTLRQIGAALTVMQTEAVKADASPDKLIAHIVTTLANINARAQEEVGGMGKAVDEAAAVVEAWKAGDKYQAAVPTGFTALDRILGGLKRSHVATLAARPSRGKTQLALQIARNTAQRIKADKRDAVVVVFSAEMAKRELALRLAQCASGVSAEWLREGARPGGPKVTDAERKRFDDALEKLRDLDDTVRIIDTPAPTTAHMYRIVAAEAALHKDGVDLVVFDYLELAGDTGGRQANETNRIGVIMRGLKRIAKAFDCSVLNIAQLNREVEKRPDRFADLDDLRQSGDIEALSEQVMFIDWPEFYKSAANGWATPQVRSRGETLAEKGANCQVFVAKNRGGRARVGALMNFTPDITRFAELADAPDDKEPKTKPKPLPGKDMAAGEKADVKEKAA